MDKTFGKIDFEKIISPNCRFWWPYCTDHVSYDKSMILPMSFYEKIDGKKIKNNYLGEIYSSTDKPSFIVILTNEESVDCIIHDTFIITKGVRIDITNLLIGENTIIGTIYNAIRDPSLVDGYLDDLRGGKNSLIVNAFYNTLDKDSNEHKQMFSAIKQINNMEPKRSAFVICNQKYLSEVVEIFRSYDSNIYQIIKE